LVSSTGLVQELFENQEFESQLLHFISQRTDLPVGVGVAGTTAGGGGIGAAGGAAAAALSSGHAIPLREESNTDEDSESRTLPPAYASRPATDRSPSQ